ncbi:MAG: SurA N-terminal domain-containing protein, partial [Patescibacteria group bacterium]
MQVKRATAKKTQVDVKNKMSSRNITGGNFLNKRNIILALAVVLVLAILALLKNQFIVVSVNGESINRLTLIRELEKQAGKKVLEGLVTNTLMLQEAKKRNITITDNELNAEIKNIDENLKKRGQSLDQVLTLQSLTIDKVKDQIKLNLIMKKLLSDKISVSDKDVSDYIEKNSKLIPQGANPDDTKNQVRQQLEQQKLQEEGQELIKSLQDKAKINYSI